jgi:tetratricopeptide (TPR) repeat protein
MPVPLLLLAMFLQQGGTAPSHPDPARAVVELQEAIRKNPQVESNYTDLGNLLLGTQNFSEAAIVLEAARAKFPNSAQAALSAGVAYYGLRRFSDSVAAFLAAGRLNPDAEQPVAFLSRMSDTWGDRKADVISLFTAYAQNHPRSALAHLALGRAAGDAAALKRATELNPKLADAHFELGVVLESNKHFPAAIASYDRAAELAPHNPVPHYRLSRLYARAGDAAKAEAERAIHEKLAAEEKARLDARQAATKHLKLSVRP